MMGCAGSVMTGECAGLQRERSDEFESKRICNTDKVSLRQRPCTELGHLEKVSSPQCEITAIPQIFSSFEASSKSGTTDQEQTHGNSSDK